jgi:hypothetical protein
METTTRIKPPKAPQPTFTSSAKSPAEPTFVSEMPFGKANYQLMIVGIVTILVGFIIMSLDSEAFGFGFFGLTLGPVVVAAGFIIEFFAILKNPKKA